MSKLIPGNQKHLTTDARIEIEKALDDGRSLRSIAIQLEKDPSTIAKEIKKHRTMRPHSDYNKSADKCVLISTCTKKHLCGIYAPICKRFCRNCNHCNSHCPDFTPKSYHCDKLDKAPS